jgi:hypothetical protein
MDIPQRKSVYDPTPVGYQVPQPSDYHHFSTLENVDYSKMVVRGWSDEGMFAFGHGRTGLINPSEFGSLTFLPYTGSRYHRNGGAISPVEIKWPEDYTPINNVGMGLTNNREDSNGSGIGIHYFTYTYETDDSGVTRYNYAFGSDYPLIYTEAPMGSGCDDASGFIRPVKDRSTPVPLNGDLGNAGEYTDKTW